MNRKQLLRQIMEYDFVQYELNLYLDTHPDDIRALKIFKQVSETAKELRKTYEENFGPITASGNTANTWQWIESPWPWDN